MQVKSVYEFNTSGDVAAEINFIKTQPVDKNNKPVGDPVDTMPVLRIYANDPKLATKAMVDLVAANFFKFYTDYFQPLDKKLRAELKEGYKAYKDRIVNHFNFDYVQAQLDDFVAELNLVIARYRKEGRLDQLPEQLRKNKFAIEDLYLLMTMNDLQKGAEAGSSAVRFVKTAGKITGAQLIHNVDIPSFGVLGAHTLGVIRYTPHYRNDLELPQITFSLTFTPGLMSYSMCNDNGLVVTRNEATKKDTMRFEEKGIPESILIQQLVENCNTVADVKEYLLTHKPATSHILTVMDASGVIGVLETLPLSHDRNFNTAHFRLVHIDDTKDNEKHPPHGAAITTTYLG
ncbi:MAG: C45 family peptidase, partial [Pseudomonadota bacterium]|nr:C45 family peptidase [Pseudomonadota bacterium]